MILRSALLLFAAAAIGAAQGPGMFPWWDSPIARDLNLTEDQQQRIRSTVRDSREQLIQLRANVEKAEAELRDLMSDEPVDARRVSEAIEKVIAARGELTRSVSQMSVKLRQVLTLRQWQELQRRQPGPGRRQGGPHPGFDPSRRMPSGPPPDRPQPDGGN